MNFGTDDDGGGILMATPCQMPCDCTGFNHHASLRCAGCDTCYFKSLERFNSEQDGKRKAIMIEYNHDDTVISTEFGILRWICPACDQKFLSNGQLCLTKYLDQCSSDNNNIINKDVTMQDGGHVRSDLVQLVTENFKALGDQVAGLANDLKVLEEKSDAVSSDSTNAGFITSPFRKRARRNITYANAVQTSGFALPPHFQIDTGNASKNDLQKDDHDKTLDVNISPAKPVPKFRVALSADETQPPLCETLAKAAKNGTVADYDYKTFGRNNVDLLFETLKDAEVEYKKLLNNLNGIKVSKPDINRPKRAHLVGLSDYHTEGDVKDYIYNRYGNELKLDSDNLDCLKVISINPCDKKNTLYRATLLVSEDVLNIIEKRFHNKLRIGYVSCTVYPYKPHKRCYTCQEHGHFKRECKQTSPTCALCAGNHSTDQCDQTTRKCINCFKSNEFKNMCDDHSADSRNCPVFRAFRDKQC